MAETKKVRVLYVVESFSTGVYAIVRDIACNLDRNSFDIHILHSLREDSPKTIEQDFNQDNITLFSIPMGSLKAYGKAVKAIRSHISSFAPDAIHLHSSKAGVLGRLALPKRQKTRIFYSPHGFSFLREDVGRIKRSIFLSLERLIHAYRPATVIAVSNGEAEHARRITGNVITINNFIDTKQFTARRGQEGPYIVTCGRISPQKNPALFNEIAMTLPQEQFMWIGDGPLRDQLTAANITVTGLLSRPEAIQKVMEAKLYMQTSLWEGMPVSILEAMAAGKAVIASDIVGNRDLIQDGETGYLCDTRSTEAFSRRVSELLRSKEKRFLIGAQAEAFVSSHHDMRKAVHTYERVYYGDSL